MFRASSTALLDSSDVFSMGRSGNSLLLVGTRDSEVRLFTRHDKGWKAANTSLSAAASDGVAVTSAVTGVEVHPERNMAIVTCSDGNVSLWHLGRRQLIHAFVEKEADPQNLAQQREANNEVYVCKLRPGGGAFGTGGKDTLVRLYDEETLSQIAVLAAGAEDGVVRAHSSKVNALAWIDEHTVMSGGWDYTVQVWDTRQNRSIKSIYGPYLCADGIDIHPDGKSFVTASTRSTEQLQVWDVRTFEKTLDIPWPGSVDPAPTLMTARFSPGSGKYLAAGGSRDFRLFDVGGSSQRSGITPPQVCDALDPAFPVFALRWMAADELIVAGARTVALNLVH